MRFDYFIDEEWSGVILDDGPSFVVTSVTSSESALCVRPLFNVEILNLDKPPRQHRVLHDSPPPHILLTRLELPIDAAWHHPLHLVLAHDS